MGAIEVFARLAYNYEQMEVFNMLLDPLDRCVQYNIAYCQISLSILTEVETLKQQIKATKDSSGIKHILLLRADPGGVMGVKRPPFQNHIRKLKPKEWCNGIKMP